MLTYQLFILKLQRPCFTHCGGFHTSVKVLPLMKGDSLILFSAKAGSWGVSSEKPYMFPLPFQVGGTQTANSAFPSQLRYLLSFSSLPAIAYLGPLDSPLHVYIARTAKDLSEGYIQILGVPRVFPFFQNFPLQYRHFGSPRVHLLIQCLWFSACLQTSMWTGRGNP